MAGGGGRRGKAGAAVHEAEAEVPERRTRFFVAVGGDLIGGSQCVAGRRTSSSSSSGCSALKDSLRIAWRAAQDALHSRFESTGGLDDDGCMRRILALRQESDALARVRRDQLFNSSVSSEEESIIQKRVELQRLQFQQFEQREMLRKIARIQHTFNHITREEAEEAIRDSHGDEEQALLNFTMVEFVVRMRKVIAVRSADLRKSRQRNQEEQAAYDRLLEKRRKAAKKTTSEDIKKRSIKYNRLRLDDALDQLTKVEDPNKVYEGWSEARIRAYKQIHTKPNSYYYRFNAPGEKQGHGAWTTVEKARFFKRLGEVGANGQWGLFAMAIPGRVGYQCSNFYRHLLKTGEIQDPNYVIDEKGELHYLFGRKSGASVGAVRVHSKQSSGGSLTAFERRLAQAAALNAAVAAAAAVGHGGSGDASDGGHSGVGGTDRSSTLVLSSPATLVVSNPSLSSSLPPSLVGSDTDVSGVTTHTGQPGGASGVSKTHLHVSATSSLSSSCLSTNDVSTSAHEPHQSTESQPKPDSSHSAVSSTTHQSDATGSCHDGVVVMDTVSVSDTMDSSNVNRCDGITTTLTAIPVTAKLTKKRARSITEHDVCVANRNVVDVASNNRDGESVVGGGGVFVRRHRRRGDVVVGTVSASTPASAPTSRRAAAGGGGGAGSGSRHRSSRTYHSDDGDTDACEDDDVDDDDSNDGEFVPRGMGQSSSSTATLSGSGNANACGSGVHHDGGGGVKRVKHGKSRVSVTNDDVHGSTGSTTHASRDDPAVSTRQQSPITTPNTTTYTDMTTTRPNARSTENPLPNFTDPITLEEVIKPAISPYGHVMGYDSWIRCLTVSEPRNVCPITKRGLSKRELVVLTFDNVDVYRSKIVNW